MAKSERKRTMVYSNVKKKGKKKADAKSASNNNEVINLDNEIVIGLASFPKPEGIDVNLKEEKENNVKTVEESGQPVEKLSQKIKKIFHRNKKEPKELEEEFYIGIENNNNKKNSKKLKLFNKTKDIKKENNKKITDKNIVNKKAINDKAVYKKENKQKDNNQNNINKSPKVSKKIIVTQMPKKAKPLTKQEKIKIQKRRIIKRISACALLIVLLIGGLVYFFLSPVFNVKGIDVINNNYISSEQIINASEIPLNENMFKFSKREAKNKILTNPYIEKVNIKRNIFTDRVQIDVKERVATLMLEYGNSYVYINNQGYVLEISATKIDSPILKGYVTPLEDVKPGKRLNNSDLERLEDVLNIMEAANSKQIGNLITHIDISNKKQYVLTLESEDKTVYLGDNKNLSTKMLYVKEMLEREKGIEGEFFLNMDLNLKDPMFREKV